MDRAFKKGVIGTNVEAVCEHGQAPVDLVPPTHVSMFQLVWSKSNGRCDVQNAVQKAIVSTTKLCGTKGKTKKK